MTTANDVIKEVNSLAGMWRDRHSAFRKWYSVIQLHNDLKQPGMESVISSDPRTGFNMAKWLLTPKLGSFVIDQDGMEEEEITNSAIIQQFANRQIILAKRRTRTTLNGAFLNRLTGLMLATGWYAVASMPTPSGWMMEAWNPAQVFPDYGIDGSTVRLARRYNVTGREVKHKAMMGHWKLSGRFNDGQKYTLHSLWKMTGEGPVHAIAIGSELVKPPMLAPFNRIPVYTAPAGGLPDDGSIMQDESWRAEIGESLVTPIMDIQKNYDKMLTYMQQLLRDTANPRWVERVRGGSVVSSDRLFERGAVFTIEPDESIDPIATPPLPPEMRGHQFDLRQQVQRGLFSDISFGNITGQVSGFLMNQVTAASKQTLDPFAQGIMNVLGELATQNIKMMRHFGLPLGNVEFPPMPEELFLDYEYDIIIPGDFLQRASTARTLNPNFKLSTQTLMNELFPEVRNVTLEHSQIQTEDALQNPVFKQVVLLRNLGRAAQEARQANDLELGDWLDKAGDLIEERFLGDGGQPQQGGVPGIRPEALPPEVQEAIAG